MSLPRTDGSDVFLDTLVERIVERLGRQLQPVPPERSPWMNIHTAAGYLDWPRQRLYKLAAQGAIPHYKQDGRLLFNRDDLDGWLAGFRRAGLEERVNES
jgi:excisionase family DNA binding protein